MMSSSFRLVRVGQAARRPLVLAALLVCVSLTGVSAHVVRGLAFPAFATAFVSSPSAGIDAPVPIVWGAQDTGLRVACFFVANSSPPLAGLPAHPRVTGVGFELPGSPAGFALVSPRDGSWTLLEGEALPVAGHGAVALDFALVAAPVVPLAQRGLPPGQAATRGSGTRFCVSGPFPDTINGTATTIETLLNGVIVGFQAESAGGVASDLGVWIDPQRVIPLYP